MAGEPKPRVCRGCLKRPATRLLSVRDRGAWPVCPECFPRQYRIAAEKGTVDGVSVVPHRGPEPG